MIAGVNPSDVITGEEYEQFASGLGDIMQVDKVIENLEKRRQNVLSGGINCIPWPFERFRAHIPGIEQGRYVIVSASQKTGKTLLASYLYIYTVLDYAFEHSDQCSVHIIYFPLEESVQQIIERYMSYLLFKLDGIRLAPTDLRSTSVDYPVPEEVLELLKSDRYQQRLKFFEECVQFDLENTNPTGILRSCENYAKSVGKYRTHKKPSAADFTKEVDVFDDYEQYDPNHYKIVFIDHIGLVDKEQGFTTKNSIDKTSEYFVKYLRNRYNYTCVAVQQQAADSEGLEAIKQKRMVPSSSGLGDSKTTSRDADLVLGLFDPNKFGLPTWLGYDICNSEGIGLRGNGRFLYVLENRHGIKGGVCPLFFDGAVCNFEELPVPSNVTEISQYYNKAASLRSFHSQQKAATLSALSLPIMARMLHK